MHCIPLYYYNFIIYSKTRQTLLSNVNGGHPEAAKKLRKFTCDRYYARCRESLASLLLVGGEGLPLPTPFPES